jgi:hypothetical protein
MQRLFGIGLQRGYRGFRFFGCQPMIRIGSRRSDRHCFLVGVLKDLSERGLDVLRAFLTLRGHFQSIGLFAVFKPGRFADQSSFTVTKKACQNFEAGLLWTLAISYILVG